jgi:hypothetical protein
MHSKTSQSQGASLCTKLQLRRRHTSNLRGRTQLHQSINQLHGFSSRFDDICHWHQPALIAVVTGRPGMAVRQAKGCWR